jgi:hypothetical protein
MAAAVLSPGCPKATQDTANRACHQVLCEKDSRMKTRYPVADGVSASLFFYFLLHHGQEYGVSWMSVGLNDAYRKWIVADGWVPKAEPVVLRLGTDNAMTRRRRRITNADNQH